MVLLVLQFLPDQYLESKTRLRPDFHLRGLEMLVLECSPDQELGNHFQETPQGSYFRLPALL
jgi:hypothetical protein